MKAAVKSMKVNKVLPLVAAVLALLGVFTGALSYIGQIATSRAQYEEMVREFSIALFVGFFLSFLCFIAAASTLYVKTTAIVNGQRCGPACFAAGPSCPGALAN